MEKWVEVEVRRGSQVFSDKVAIERGIRLVVNGRLVATVRLSPGDEEEFAIGYLLGEGFIKKASEIKGVKKYGSDLVVEIGGDFERAYEGYLLSSDCLSGWRTAVKREGVKVESDFKVSEREIYENLKRLAREAVGWRQTGGMHSVALVTPNRFLLVEDISRHVAVDKAIGKGAKIGEDLSNSYLLLSGRVPGDMVIKVARANIPIIVSRAAPLDSGIQCAKETNVTLAGFARGQRMNIYAHGWRILP